MHGNARPRTWITRVFGALFPLVPLGTALKTTSQYHDYYALATSMLGTQSSLFESFGLFWDAFGGCLLA